MYTNWGNITLVAYSLLPKIANQIDYAVKTRINSSYKSQHLKMGLSNEQLIGEILAQIDEKRRMINLAYLFNSTLKRLRERDRAIIEERYVDRKTCFKIAEEQNVALRTVFRRIDIAKQKFSEALAERGYTDEWFEKEYGDDKYIAALKKRMEREKYTTVKR